MSRAARRLAANMSVLKGIYFVGAVVPEVSHNQGIRPGQVRSRSSSFSRQARSAGRVRNICPRTGGRYGSAPGGNTAGTGAQATGRQGRQNHAVAQKRGSCTGYQPGEHCLLCFKGIAIMKTAGTAGSSHPYRQPKQGIELCKHQTTAQRGRRCNRSSQSSSSGLKACW